MSDSTVAVIGAGVIGTATALELARRGLDVVVLDRGGVAAGCSRGNAGWLTPCFSTPLPAPGVLTSGLKWLLDAESPLYIAPSLRLDWIRWMARFALSARQAPYEAGTKALLPLSNYSLEAYRRLDAEAPGTFGFAQRGLLVATQNQDVLDHAAHEAERMERLGVRSRRLDAAGVQALEPALKWPVVGGIYYPDEAHCEPLAAVQALARAAEAAGARFATAEVLGFETAKGKLLGLETTQGKVRAERFVLATGSWSKRLGRTLSLRLPVLGGKGYTVLVDELAFPSHDPAQALRAPRGPHPTSERGEDRGHARARGRRREHLAAPRGRGPARRLRRARAQQRSEGDRGVARPAPLHARRPAHHWEGAGLRQSSRRHRAPDVRPAHRPRHRAPGRRSPPRARNRSSTRVRSAPTGSDGWGQARIRSSDFRAAGRTPLYSRPVPPAAGQSLLHYRLIEPIGQGGMGVVWRATDSTLGRDAAVKLLPDAFSADPERLARFEREAKLLASLNHPNIASVYGLHVSEGQRFLAMEMVRGEDLSSRLARGPLPVDETLAIARQVADALETAHENGVIHRDLKPANIRVTPDGTVKVLDFGLAKAFETAPASGTSLSGASPTVTSAGSVMGLILGTAAYMSPEQARGKPVDRRTDVWSFGCVLYEMLTGLRPFEGETISDSIGKILQTEPDLAVLPPGTPRVVRELIARCLVKDAKRRLRDMGDARLALEDAARPEVAPTVALAPVASRRFAWVPWTVAGLAIAVAAGALVLAPGRGAGGGARRRRQVPRPERAAGAAFHGPAGGHRRGPRRPRRSPRRRSARTAPRACTCDAWKIPRGARSRGPRARTFPSGRRTAASSDSSPRTS